MPPIFQRGSKEVSCYHLTRNPSMSPFWKRGTLPVRLFTGKSRFIFGTCVFHAKRSYRAGPGDFPRVFYPGQLKWWSDVSP
jgi:hypothetical protein